MKNSKAIFFAVLAAVLYAINSPVSKLLLENVPAKMMAGFLYLGAGIGIFLLGVVQKLTGAKQDEQPLTKKELPYTIAMVVLDIAAPIFLMFGLTMTTAANASLLNNFEIVATSIIALVIFKEAISKRLWLAIGLVTLSSAILSFEDMSSLDFSYGSIFVLLACVCWGMENNCTRNLSSKDPMDIVVIKGFGSGIGAFIIAVATGEKVPGWGYIAVALLLGFVAYGLSIYFYIYAQRYLGAAKTSAYYAIAPFVGTGLSLVIFRQAPTVSFIVATVIMIAGTYLATIDGAEQ
ncbi:MAG: DMT family transporter [Oscillospiraceae bacterium]|nr:DMT family transporter [Oscillospiraceae bacterium]